MRAIGYVRVSTVDQAKGNSPDTQAARIRAWCAAGGHDLADDEIFFEAGLSGKRADNRPELVKALARACDGTGAVLVVYSLSRLARSTRDTLAIAERMAKAGADLASVSESIDTSSASGKMIFRLLAVLAEFERELIVERTVSGLARIQAKGRRTGSVPIGFALAADGKTLVPDAAERAAVAEIRALAAEGLGPRKIWRSLKSRGLACRGSQWSESTIRRILKRAERW